MIEQGQQFKHQLAKRFLQNYRQNNVTLCNNVLKEIESFKKCYNQELLKKFRGNNEDLAWMFFEDGCALMEFVESYRFGWFAFYDMNIDRDQLKLMAIDVILLVNQLPLAVLNLVMGERREYLTSSIHEFAEDMIGMIHFEGRAKDEKADSTTDWSFVKENHLLELIWKKLVKEETLYRSESSDNNKASPRQFRSVKDLQAAGIILETNNSSSSLRDISFDGGIFFCKLKIPSFRVSEEGKFLVLNLIEFEMSPKFGKPEVITSYISFLNSLITTNEDVAELRKAGILINYLPNDEDVLKTFRELTSILKPYSDIFDNIKEKLIAYFNDKKSMTTGKWLSEAMHVYFRSQWTTIAFVSATILLIMTIIQTVFSVLAYPQRQ